MSVERTVSDSLLKAIRKTSVDAFGKSRDRVPVETGFLKQSGLQKDIPNGAEIDYTADYASWVEFGTRPGIRTSKPYITKTGRAARGRIYYSRGQKAQSFLGSSMEDSFTKGIFENNFENELKNSLFGSAKVIRI